MSTNNAEVERDLISVVVPIYNVEKTLDECLSSIESQTHRRLEVICVNDGSTDGSSALAHEHAARDSRVMVVDKPNEGYGASCNRGMGMARGAWVAIVEPDDFLEPTCYEELLACAEKYGGVRDVDVVRCAYWRVFEDSEGADGPRTTCPYKGRIRPRRQPFAVGDGIELLRHHPSVWSGMYRRDYLAQRRIRFVEAPGSGWVDNPFLVESLCRTNKICYLDRPLYVYREHALDDASAFAARFPLVPLTRWNDMLDAAALAGVDDARIVAALALRGVNYALITVGAAGDAAGVRKLVESSMRRIDEDVVMAEPRISPAGKRLYAQACGLPEPKVDPLPHYAHLAGEALYRVRTNGLGFALRTARARLADRE